MFERIDYVVGRIDGDYAYLNQLANSDAEEKCVARALLPDGIDVGTKLAYASEERIRRAASSHAMPIPPSCA